MNDENCKHVRHVHVACECKCGRTIYKCSDCSALVDEEDLPKKINHVDIFAWCKKPISEMTEAEKDKYFEIFGRVIEEHPIGLPLFNIRMDEGELKE